MESHTDEQRPSEKGARTEGPVDASPKVRCILALPESAAVTPPDLAEAFAARSIEVRKVVGPFAAMAELLLAQRDAHRAIALVIVEPSRFMHERGEELISAAGRWIPRSALWVYAREQSPRLRRWVAPPEPALPGEYAKVNGIGDAIRATAGAPNLRLTGVNDEAPPPEYNRAESSAAAMGETELTDEELAMLLGTEEPEADHPPDDPSKTHDGASS